MSPAFVSRDTGGHRPTRAGWCPARKSACRAAPPDAAHRVPPDPARGRLCVFRRDWFDWLKGPVPNSLPGGRSDMRNRTLPLSAAILGVADGPDRRFGLGGFVRSLAQRAVRPPSARKQPRRAGFAGAGHDNRSCRMSERRERKRPQRVRPNPAKASTAGKPTPAGLLPGMSPFADSCGPRNLGPAGSRFPCRASSRRERRNRFSGFQA